MHKDKCKMPKTKKQRVPVSSPGNADRWKGLVPTITINSAEVTSNSWLLLNPLENCSCRAATGTKSRERRHRQGEEMKHSAGCGRCNQTPGKASEQNSWKIVENQVWTSQSVNPLGVAENEFAPTWRLILCKPHWLLKEKIRKSPKKQPLWCRSEGKERKSRRG